MPTRQFKTTLKDADGVEHAYSCASFPSGESIDLFLEITEIVSGPIGHALTIVFGGAEDSEEMNLSAVPDALRDIPRMIIAKGGSKLIQRILSKCRRNRAEKDPRGKDIWDNLGNESDFDQVYAGNLLEAAEAVKWVVTEVNYRPFFAVNMKKLSGLLEQLGSFTQTEPISSDTTRTEPES